MPAWSCGKFKNLLQFPVWVCELQVTELKYILHWHVKLILNPKYQKHFLGCRFVYSRVVVLFWSVDVCWCRTTKQPRTNSLPASLQMCVMWTVTRVSCFVSRVLVAFCERDGRRWSAISPRPRVTNLLLLLLHLHHLHPQCLDQVPKRIRFLRTLLHSASYSAFRNTTAFNWRFSDTVFSCQAPLCPLKAPHNSLTSDSTLF